MSTFARLVAGAAIAAALTVGFAETSYAGPVNGGFTTNSIPRNDDGSAAGAVALPFTANFFGTSYTELYVNNNGNVTFNAPLGVYTPTGVAGGYSGLPIISPFFADVDTRGARSNLVQYGNGTYQGRTAFGVEWIDVGYYGAHDDLLNSFELILTDRSDVNAGDFDIYFNYDRILWETGDASNGHGGFGGSSAAAGFSNGTGVPGTFYQFPGSLVNGALLDGGSNSHSANTNDGVTGQYRFQVRNGGVVVPPITGVPEPATWAMMIIGFGGVGVLLRRRERLTADLA